VNSASQFAMSFGHVHMAQGRKSFVDHRGTQVHVRQIGLLGSEEGGFLGFWALSHRRLCSLGQLRRSSSAQAQFVVFLSGKMDQKTISILDQRSNISRHTDLTLIPTPTTGSQSPLFLPALSEAGVLVLALEAPEEPCLQDRACQSQTES
jgi:hypothetical protein